MIICQTYSMKITGRQLTRLLHALWPMAILLAAALVLTVWSSRRAARPEAWLAENSNNLKELVSRLAVVPTETPQIKQLSSLEDYKDEVFYSLLQKEDLLFIYPLNGKELIFRPSQKKVVYIGDLKMKAVLEPAKIELEIRNGSANLGAAAQLAKVLEQDQALSILDINQAKDNAYSQSVVVDLSGGRYQAEVAKLVQSLGANLVNALPAGEEASKADILIIIGSGWHPEFKN